MKGNCSLCPVTDAPVFSTYKARDLGDLFCFCCRMRIYNLMEKQEDTIQERFDRMAALARLRGQHNPRELPTPKVAMRSSGRPNDFKPRPASSWAALSCPND